MIGGAIAIRQRSIVPGFGLSLGVMLSYLGLIVIIPLCVLLLKASDAGWAKIWTELSSLRTLAAFRVSFGIAFLAAAFNAGFVAPRFPIIYAQGLSSPCRAAFCAHSMG